MLGNSRGSLPGPGWSRARAQLAGYLGACPCPAQPTSRAILSSEGKEPKQKQG